MPRRLRWQLAVVLGAVGCDSSVVLSRLVATDEISASYRVNWTGTGLRATANFYWTNAKQNIVLSASERHVVASVGRGGGSHQREERGPWVYGGRALSVRSRSGFVRVHGCRRQTTEQPEHNDGSRVHVRARRAQVGASRRCPCGPRRVDIRGSSADSTTLTIR
jgi:hypothetical protein